MGITEWIVEVATGIIAAGGYLGVGVLMAAESMILPVPSEAVMPFAGFLISTGEMSWTGVAVVSTVGSIVGSLISYMIGAYGGRPLVLRFGKYLFLHEHHLELTERFFARRGTVAVFVSRFIPIVRHLISIPAGVGRMPIVPFLVVTTVGAGLWNMFLAWLGFVLGKNWDTLLAYSELTDKIILGILVLSALYVLWKLRFHRHRH